MRFDEELLFYSMRIDYLSQCTLVKENGVINDKNGCAFSSEKTARSPVKIEAVIHRFTAVFDLIKRRFR